MRLTVPLPHLPMLVQRLHSLLKIVRLTNMLAAAWYPFLLGFLVPLSNGMEEMRGKGWRQAQKRLPVIIR